MNVAISSNRYKGSKLNRYELITAIQSLGHTVFYIGLDSDEPLHPDYQKYNVSYLTTSLGRTNTNPLKEMLTLNRARRVLKKNNIKILIVYGIRTFPTMVMAARLAGVKRVVCIVNGSGRLFQLKGLKGITVRLISYPMLWLAFLLADTVLFQNPDNLQLVKSKIHLWRKNYDLINGSGVNLDDYAPTVLPEASAFLMVGRLTGDKGINEYVEAAVHVKAKHPEAEFYLVGPEDDDDKSVNVDMLNKAVSEGVIQYAGKVEDVRPFINRCRVFVLPSYHEGTPRTVLEAMSMGRPIITTDATGCRETVEEGVNGFKVPVKSKDILAEKMIWMIEHPDETAQMGVRSRRMCEKKYDVRSINKKIIKNLEA